MRTLQHATGSVKVFATWFSRWRSGSRVLTVAAASVLLAVGLFASPAAAVTAESRAASASSATTQTDSRSPFTAIQKGGPTGFLIRLILTRS